MFIFKRKSIHIDCFTKCGAYAIDHPIQKASNFLPDWWKQLPKKVVKSNQFKIDIDNPTMKGCVGFINLYKTGIILPMWRDLYVRFDTDMLSYQFRDNGMNDETVTSHSSYQFNDKFADFTHFKIDSPWLFREKTGIKFLLTSCFTMLDEHPKLQIVNGILEFNSQYHTSINGFASKENRPYQCKISAGTPLVHFIQQSDRDIVPHVHVLDEVEYKKIKSYSAFTRFVNNGLQRSKNLILGKR